MHTSLPVLIGSALFEKPVSSSVLFPEEYLIPLILVEVLGVDRIVNGSCGHLEGCIGSSSSQSTRKGLEVSGFLFSLVVSKTSK